MKHKILNLSLRAIDLQIIISHKNYVNIQSSLIFVYPKAAALSIGLRFVYQDIAFLICKQTGLYICSNQAEICPLDGKQLGGALSKSFRSISGVDKTWHRKTISMRYIMYRYLLIIFNKVYVVVIHRCSKIWYSWVDHRWKHNFTWGIFKIWLYIFLIGLTSNRG